MLFLSLLEDFLLFMRSFLIFGINFKVVFGLFGLDILHELIKSVTEVSVQCFLLLILQNFQFMIFDFHSITYAFLQIFENLPA